MIDYLRYVAFQGWLSEFFTKALDNYVDPEVTTGQHLCFDFSPDQVDEWSPRHMHFGYSDWAYRHFGIRQTGDLLTRAGAPATYRYTEDQPPPLRILIDVDPARWEPHYQEDRSFENAIVRYRPSGPARGQLSSGDRIFDRAKGEQKYGTLCGVVLARDRRRWGLTCGHVADHGARMSMRDQTQGRRWLWLSTLFGRSPLIELGTTTHVVMPSAEVPTRVLVSALDASLTEIGANAHSPMRRTDVAEAELSAISTLRQDDPVEFRGSGRSRSTMARISAITVRKSIDLRGDGVKRYMGDMLMLGHRQRMYIQQPVSRAGDSGAAVCLDVHNRHDGRGSWCGMVIGGDETAAYATYAEHLWGWAMAATGNRDIGFSYDL